MSSTPAPLRRYRWTILAAGVFAQAANSAILLGLPAIAPAIRKEFDLTLTQVGVVLAAVSFGSVATLLLWGIVADRIGERAVIAVGQTGAAAALFWAAYASSYPELIAALAVAGGVGAGVNAASGRAVMAWFGADERGLALGIRQMAVPLGGAVAALALPALTSHISLHAAFDGLAVACLAAAIVGAVFLRSEPGQEEDHSVLARPLRDPRVWRICIASTFYVTTQLSLLGFFVLFLHDHRGVSTSVAAAGLAATQVLGGIARIAVGRLSDKLHLRIVLLRRIALGLSLTVGVLAALLDALRLDRDSRTRGCRDLRAVVERPVVHRGGRGCRTRAQRRGDRAPANVPVRRRDRRADRVRDGRPQRVVAPRLRARGAQPARRLRAAQSVSRAKTLNVGLPTGSSWNSGFTQPRSPERSRP